MGDTEKEQSIAVETTSEVQEAAAFEFSSVINLLHMRSRVMVVCVCVSVCYHPSGNSFHSLTKLRVIYHDFLDFN